MLITAAAVALGFCRVIDGDSIACGAERIRLSGIDAPELRSPKCAWESLQAARARDRLRDLLQRPFMVHREGKDYLGGSHGE